MVAKIIRDTKHQTQLQKGRRSPLSYWVWGALGFLVAFIIRSSWIGDDCYIMLRMVRNIVEGNGPVYNLGERTNAVTCYLFPWLLAFCSWITGEYFLTTLLVDIVLSGLAIWLLLRYLGSDTIGRLLAAAVLFSSKAFLDYTTGGLENSLIFVSVALLGMATLSSFYQARNLKWIVLAACFVSLGRPDTVLLAAPVALWAFADFVFVRKELKFWPALGTSVLAMLPWVGWHVWHLIYYGYPFPNTYYAKVMVFKASQVPTGLVVGQGLLYLVNLVQHDLATAFIVVVGVVAAFRKPKGIRWGWGLSILAYCVYIIGVGGDFMAGRFFAVPVFITAMLVAELPIRIDAKGFLAGCCLLLSLIAPRPTYRYGKDVIDESDYYGLSGPLPRLIDHRGIADERLAYWPESGLLSSVTLDNVSPRHAWYLQTLGLRKLHTRVAVHSNIGMVGFALGPETYLLDPFGLPDPFLARLPNPALGENKTAWRIGHIPRKFPEGYFQSKIRGKNFITDPGLHKLYQATQTVATAPIWSGERWMEIINLNLGRYDAITRGYFSYPQECPLDMDDRVFVDYSYGKYCQEW